MVHGSICVIHDTCELLPSKILVCLNVSPQKLVCKTYGFIRFLICEFPNQPATLHKKYIAILNKNPISHLISYHILSFSHHYVALHPHPSCLPYLVSHFPSFSHRPPPTPQQLNNSHSHKSQYQIHMESYIVGSKWRRTVVQFANLLITFFYTKFHHPHPRNHT